MQSLDRALEVLTAVARCEGLTLSDLTREINAPTATTHRILMALQNHGFITFNDQRQEWALA